MRLKFKMENLDGVLFADQLQTTIVKIDIPFVVLNASRDSLIL